MKTIIKNIQLVLLGAALLSAGACSDLLDQRPQGQWTIDDVEGGAYFSKVAAIYSKARGFNITSGIPAFAVHNFRSEDECKGSIKADGAPVGAMYDEFKYSATDGNLNSYWGTNYDIINESNRVIAEMMQAEENGVVLSDEDKICLMECHFFRGWCFFNLVRAFGEVPLVNFAIEHADEANVAKSPIDAIYQQIDKDLTFAEGLPQSWESRYTGRLTSGAAHALHAKAYMQRGMWQQMYQQAKLVIDSKQYDLKTPFNKIFREEYENCSESVWELQCTATVAQPQDFGSQFCQVQGCRGMGTSDLGWGWHMTTKELTAAFEEGDPRRDETLLYFSNASHPWPAFAPSAGNAPYNELLTAQDGLDGAFFNKKAYCNPQLRDHYTNRFGFWFNIRMIRYSDVVLMAAEAACEMGGEQNIAEALDLLEQVRSRARGGNESVLPKVTSTVQEEVRRAIRHERRVELAMEPDRFYDLVRWGEAAEKLGKLGYQEKHKYLPLPQAQIDNSNGVLVQNPDYL